MSAIRRDLRAVLVAGGLAAIVCGLFAIAQTGGGTTAAAGLPGSSAATTPEAVVTDPAAVVGADIPAADGSAVAPTSTVTETTVAIDASLQDLDGEDLTDDDTCKFDALQGLRPNDTGANVTCLQMALTSAGFYSGATTGTYDGNTATAVSGLQKERDLFVDGIAGRETAISLGIWPDEQSFIVHTPPPAAGALDSYGYPLSYVATAGSDTPPLPANSGSGKRVVYERQGQRVWAVDANEKVIRSWLVSGSKYSNEVPGTFSVYSKSNPSTAWNGKALLPKMIRYYKTQIGNIGFHGIPRHVSDGSRYQTDQELGNRLSGGCQRQADLDADFLWDFAPVGTTVVVI